MQRVDSSGSKEISETVETTDGLEPPQLVRHHSADEGIPHHNGHASHGSVHVKFEVAGDDEEEESHHRRLRNRKNSRFGILDLNEDWVTRNHFLERLEGDALPSDVIHAKLAEIVDDQDKETETCRRKLAKHLTTTAFTIFILIIALLDAAVTITAVILQIHSEHAELNVRRTQHSMFNKFTRYAYGKKVDLENVNTNEMLDRIGKYINGTAYNATAYNNKSTLDKSIRKRDVFSYELQHSEVSTTGQGYAKPRGQSRSIHPRGRHKKRTETADEKGRGGRLLVRRKRAGGASADGLPWFESPTALELATISHYLHYASIALLSVLLIEVILKIFALGCEFFKSKVEVIDMIIISIAFFLDVYFIDSATDNVAAAILLFIWQMIRVCTTLILQDRKRIDFLLDVVRESNEANKQKVDRYEERNNALETVVQRLTTLAKYNGATETEIKRCTEIIEIIEKGGETKKSQKKPVFKSIQSVFSKVHKKRKGRKGGFTLEQLNSVHDHPQSNKRPRTKRLSTDLSVELIHKQRKASHANIHPHGPRHSLHDIMHSLHIGKSHHHSDGIRQNSHRSSQHSEAVAGLESQKVSTTQYRKRIHFLDGDLNHKTDPGNLPNPNFSFVSSSSPTSSPSVSRTSSILKTTNSPRFIRKGGEAQSSPHVSRSSSLARKRKDVVFVNGGFSEGEEDKAGVNALENRVVVPVDGGGANVNKVRRNGVGFCSETTDGNDLDFSSSAITSNDLRDSKGIALTTHNENFPLGDSSTDPLHASGYYSPHLSPKKLHGILKRTSSYPTFPEEIDHFPEDDATVNNENEVA